MYKKTCKRCGEEKEISEFHKHKKSKYGVRSICKDCRVITKKNYYDDNRSACVLYSKKYYEENKESVDEYKKYWYEKNRESQLESGILRYQKKKNDKEYKEKSRVSLKRWRQENPSKYKAQKQKRRACVAGGGGSFTANEWDNLCERYDHKCLCCGRKKKLTADHVIPVSKGGTSYISNIQPLCGSCNSSKGAKETDYR